MARVNDHYLKLRSSYLFTEIATRVKTFQEATPGARMIRLDQLPIVEHELRRRARGRQREEQIR